MCFLSASFKPRYFYSRERAEMFSEIADGLRKVLIKGKGNRVSIYNKLYGSFAFTDKI